MRKSVPKILLKGLASHRNDQRGKYSHRVKPIWFIDSVRHLNIYVIVLSIFLSSFLLCIVLLKDKFAMLKSQNPFCNKIGTGNVIVLIFSTELNSSFSPNVNTWILYSWHNYLLSLQVTKDHDREKARTPSWEQRIENLKRTWIGNYCISASCLFSAKKTMELKTHEIKYH